MQTGWYKIVGSRLVTRYWPVVIAAWLGVAVLLHNIAPRWDSIAADGDLTFLPDSVPSAVGQRAVAAAFPGALARSQLIFLCATQADELSTGDLALALDITRRLHWAAAKNAWEAAVSVAGRGAADSVQAEIARENLDEAIAIEELLMRFVQQQESRGEFKRFPDAHRMRGELLTVMGEDPEQAALDLDTAQLIRSQRIPTLAPALPRWANNIVDVWSWRHGIVGHKLGSSEPRARLIVVQLSSDFTAVGNIETVEGIDRLVDELRAEYSDLLSTDLRFEMSGSAAVGTDMLQAAASGVRKTETVTVLLVLLILSAVYRAPFLVAIPLLSIALSFVVATSLIALLARDPADPGSWGLGVFTTTRIFIVVLLFGAGTDFCLFFLARNREILQKRLVQSRRHMHRVVAKAWCSVHDALVVSAATTIVGLALMWFSEFEKFQFSGPIIAISLAVTLLVCLSFTPALLSGLGPVAFWPQLRRGTRSSFSHADRTQSYWNALAGMIESRPATALLVTLFVLCLPAGYGVTCLHRVTYDLTEELSDSAPSRRGSRLIGQFFPTQESSPVTVLLNRDRPFDSDAAMRAACTQLAHSLYLPGVESVRSLTDPLGDYPPGKRMGLFDRDAWRRRLLNRIARERYISSVTDLELRVARFDVVLEDNPFSLQAGNTLSQLERRLAKEVADPNSAWFGADVVASGITVGITDLRLVTQSDQRRIQILVTIGVWLVLLCLIREWVLSTYLIFTVLLSYFATLGITYATFSLIHGPDYSGLDWKVPLFLFVILVAVGQDYNVYLITRIFEERAAWGLRAGVRRAVAVTGGIITSCGFVMAGTFIAMTSPAVLQWFAASLPEGWIDTQAPVLRGITELGFALALGVLLDTLIVRSVLVPSFVLLWEAKKERPSRDVERVSKGV